MNFTYTSDLEIWLMVTIHSIPSSTLWRQCWKHLYFNCLFFYWSKTYLAVETKSLSSPPCSSNCSRVLASPVDWRPMTTHWKITSEISTSWLGIENHIHYDHKNYCNLSKISELKAQVTSLGNKGAFISLLL